MPAAAGGFDADPVRGRGVSRCLGAQLFAVAEVSARLAVFAAIATARRVMAALAEQTETHRREGFDLADETVAAVVSAATAAVVAQGKLAYAQREFALQRLDRCV